MALQPPNQENVLRALTKYESLRQLENATGTPTDRARSRILRSLNDSDRTALAMILKKRGLTSKVGAR